MAHNVPFDRIGTFWQSGRAIVFGKFICAVRSDEAKMKNTDKFLVAIVAGVVLLVAAAFGVAALRPKPAYQAEDAPDGVVHNYLLAIKQADYDRAYGYLSPKISGYPPTAADFARDVRQSSYNFQLDNPATTVSIQAAYVTDNRAEVIVHETIFQSNGLFGSSEYPHSTTFQLRRESEQWKIYNSDQSYWTWCWSNADGC